VVADVSNVRINGWSTSDLLRMMDSMICIIHAYHAIHTLVMLMVKAITLAKYANMFNPKVSTSDVFNFYLPWPSSAAPVSDKSHLPMIMETVDDRRGACNN
jgi:hypothetical protein